MDLKKTGNFISSVRKARGMTQKELAGRLQVSDRAVSKWERGAGFPDVSILTQLADELGVTVTELLQGEPASSVSNGADDMEAADSRAKDAELTVREAVNAIYEQTRARAKKNRLRILAAVLAVAVVCGSFGLGLKKLGEDRILFPPKITCEILQGRDEVDFAGELLVDKVSQGVYNYNCRYEIDRYGNVQMAERGVWESFADTVSGGIYKSLKKLCPGELTTIWDLENGFLAEYHRQDTGEVVLIETDLECEPLFTCGYDSTPYSAPCITAFLLDGKLYAVAYIGTEQRMYVISVDKADGTMEQYSFTYSDLSGRGTEERNKTGGFMFDGQNMWVKNGVLYFAEAHCSGRTMSVVAAYDLEKGMPLVFRELEGSHIVAVKKELDRGRVMVLVNPMNYEPLQLVELDAETLDVVGVTELELPHEYMSRVDYNDYGNYLFETDLTDDGVLVLYPDVFSETQLREQEERSLILALYDRRTGDMTWRARLMLDVEYDVYGVCLKTDCEP